MKKPAIFFRSCIGLLCMLVALVFAGIEIWQLASLDWKLYENPALAFAQICAKLLLALFCFGTVLRAILQKERPFLREGLWLLAISLAATPFLSNHLGWALVLSAAVFLLAEGFSFPPERKK